MDALYFVTIGIAGCFGLLYITERARRRLAEIALDGAYNSTVSKHAEHWRLVRELTASEGNSVEIYCDNPEGPPNNGISVCGDFTEWEAKRIDGDSLLICLQEAKRMMLAYNHERAESWR